jgi:hypothetical protein
MRRALILVFVIALAAGAVATVSRSTTLAPKCGPYGDLPREGAPIVSRDGRVLAWARWGWRDQRSRVFVSAPDGSAAAPVSVPSGARDDDPLALSPDGSEVLIHQHGELSRYILASTAGSVAARFVSEHEAREVRRSWRTPEWSPDGRYRVEAEYGAVWVVSADGTERRRIASTELSQGAAWSPDGTLIAIGTDGEGLHVVKPDGTGLRRLTGIYSLAQSPVWSPDGSWIAFEIDGSTSKSGSSISVIRPDGSALRALTRRHQGPDQREANSPSWLDEKTLIFTNYQHTHNGPHKIYDIHAIGVDGRNERRVSYQCHLGSRGDNVLRGSILGDTMRAFAGDDDVRPGPGADDVDAGAGRDLVRSREGTRDVIRCGPGHDKVLADRRDRIARDCEWVLRR